MEGSILLVGLIVIGAIVWAREDAKTIKDISANLSGKQSDDQYMDVMVSKEEVTEKDTIYNTVLNRTSGKSIACFACDGTAFSIRGALSPNEPVACDRISGNKILELVCQGCLMIQVYSDKASFEAS